MLSPSKFRIHQLIFFCKYKKEEPQVFSLGFLDQGDPWACVAQVYLLGHNMAIMSGGN